MDRNEALNATLNTQDQATTGGRKLAVGAVLVILTAFLVAGVALAPSISTASRVGAFLFLAGGLAIGLVLAVVGVITMMPSMMIVTHESSLDLEETVEAVKKGIADNGWASPWTSDLNQQMANKGVAFNPEVRVIGLCKAQYASQVLTTDRQMSSMMPCAISVWRGDDGKVYVSKMNTGLMGKMFGGNVARVMGNFVAREEKAILNGVIKR